MSLKRPPALREGPNYETSENKRGPRAFALQGLLSILQRRMYHNGIQCYCKDVLWPKHARSLRDKFC